MIADARTKVYGDADPALTYQVSGLKNGDTAGAVLNGGSLSRVAGFDWGLRTRINQANHEVHLYSGSAYRTTIICRSMEKPQTIVGFKVGRSLVDELDVLSLVKAQQAERLSAISAGCRRMTPLASSALRSYWDFALSVA